MTGQKTKRKKFANGKSSYFEYTSSMLNQIETNIEIVNENRNRTTVFFRLVLSLPIFFFLFLFEVHTFQNDWSEILLVLPVIAALVVRNVYPSWLLNFNHALMEFSARAGAFMFLLNDEYPTFERNPKISVIFPDVEGGKKLNRWLPLVKWILAIPLFIVGIIYLILATVVVVLAWFAILFTGKFPIWAGNFILGTFQFWNRIYGYALILVTDKYPSFSL